MSLGDLRLICYVRRPGAILYAGAIADQLRASTPQYAEAWLVGSVESDQSDDYALFRPHPAPWEYRLRFLQYCAETPQLAVVDAGQGASEAVPHGFIELAQP